MAPPAFRRSFRGHFGDAAIVLFLLAQAADGAFTYVGVMLLGMGTEGNPLLLSMMAALGIGPTLLGAKGMAAALGVGLHLLGVHRVVWLLTAVYLAGAVVPWLDLLTHSL